LSFELKVSFLILILDFSIYSHFTLCFFVSNPAYPSGDENWIKDKELIGLETILTLGFWI
jgi:hypothetical protein